MHDISYRPTDLSYLKGFFKNQFLRFTQFLRNFYIPRPRIDRIVDCLIELNHHIISKFMRGMRINLQKRNTYSMLKLDAT